MKRVTATLLVLLLGGLAACGEEAPDAPGATAAPAPRKLTFNMSWLPQGSMAGVFAAMDRGFYAERGLEVEAIRGFGGIRTVNELDQGMSDFAYADPLAVILNRANGGHTRMIGALNQNWPAGLCFVRERHAIAKPADLAGLKLGGGQSSPMQVIVPLWLRQNGVDPAAVELLQLDPAVIAASVVEGKIDAGECWRGNSRPIYEARAAEAGVHIDWIEYAAFGLDIYGSGLVTRDALIASEPEMVASFVEATYRGYAWAAEHQDEAVAIMLARFPVLDAAITRAQLAETVELLRGPGRVGWMEEAKVRNTLRFLSSAYGVDKALAPADVYTMQFIGTP